ncbi:MAG: hypothetical protein JO046_14150 [Solirubrobacterales bacterium]|nr:hypothetical protein [Solirubrobacterales bacterium]
MEAPNARSSFGEEMEIIVPLFEFVPFITMSPNTRGTLVASGSGRIAALTSAVNWIPAVTP